jgi:hypothetical protein
LVYFDVAGAPQPSHLFNPTFLKHIKMPGDSQIIFYGVVASQLVTLLAYAVVTVGVGASANSP